MNRFKTPAALFTLVALIIVMWSIYAISEAYIMAETRAKLIREIRLNGGDVHEVLHYQGRDSKPNGGVGLWRWIFGDKAYGAVVVADEPYFANTSRFTQTFPEASLICTLSTIKADTISIEAAKPEAIKPAALPR